MEAMDFQRQMAIAMAAAISGLAVAVVCVVCAILYKRRKFKKRQKLIDDHIHRGTSSRISRHPRPQVQQQDIPETPSTDTPFIIAGNLSTQTSPRVNPVYLEDGMKRNRSLRLDYSLNRIPRTRFGNTTKPGGCENDSDFRVGEQVGDNMDASGCKRNGDYRDGPLTTQVSTPANAWFTGSPRPSVKRDRYPNSLLTAGADTKPSHVPGVELNRNSMIKHEKSSLSRGTFKDNSMLKGESYWLSRNYLLRTSQMHADRTGIHFYRTNSVTGESRYGQAEGSSPQIPARRSSSLLWRENRIGNFA